MLVMSTPPDPSAAPAAPVAPVTRVFLLGLSGSGKSTVGRRAAALLGWTFLDTDELVEERAGMSIARLFAERGEEAFRALEAEALAEAARAERVVIATGGGVVVRAANRALLRENGWRVALHVSPSTALARLTQERLRAGSAAPERPLLAGDDPLQRLHALRERRQRFYDEADDAVATDGLDAATVAARIVAGLVARGFIGGHETGMVAQIAGSPGERYEAVVAWGGLATLGVRLAALGLPPRLHLVSDSHVALLYGPPVLAQLAAAGFDADLWTLPAGEASKNREQLAALHDWLAERRAERREAVVALGGGVVGDLAGFAAATYLRGVPLVHVPTTLLAQVDSSIGGKVGINHPLGKNLLGAFHQPTLVLADPATLLTLPERVRTEGWAEVIKHGAALDAASFAALERDADALRALDPAATTRAIAESVELKGRVVESDVHEREGGRRVLLNYGHTIGHALEAMAGYGAWLHGEAVAVGMAVAARVGQRLGLTPPGVVARQDALLKAFGLPLRCPSVPAAALLRAALWDKKVRGGRVHWVLLTELGAARVVGDVPDEVVRAALLDLGANDAPDEPGAAAGEARNDPAN
jgi:3-dehydroquinate synthase